MGEKIRLVVSSLCIFQWMVALFRMAYSSTTPMVRDLGRSPEFMVLSRPVTALSDFNASHVNNRLLLHPGDSDEDLAAAAAAAVALSLKSVRRTEFFLTDSALNLKNLEVQASTRAQAPEDDDTPGTGEKAQVTVISFTTSKSVTFYRSSNFSRNWHSNSSQKNTVSGIDQPFRWREMSKVRFWIRTNAIVNGLTSTSSSKFNSKQAVLGLRICVRASIELENFSGRWRRNFHQHNPTIDNPQLNVFGLDGYDIAGALAMAGDAVEAANFGYQKAKNSKNLSLVCGQLQSSTFETVNIESKSRGDKGLWKPQNRLQKILNLMGKASNSTSWDDLRSIVWPVDSAPFPRGCCNKRNLRVGEPVKYESGEFVTVKRKSVTGYGYGIVKYMANLEEMSSANVSEFTYCGKPIKDMAATYNDLVYQVYAMNFHAVVGDITVINCMLPFRKSDPTQDGYWRYEVNHWLVYIYFFAFIGSVVWILVKLVNDDFESQTRQARTSL